MLALEPRQLRLLRGPRPVVRAAGGEATPGPGAEPGQPPGPRRPRTQSDAAPTDGGSRRPIRRAVGTHGAPASRRGTARSASTSCRRRRRARGRRDHYNTDTLIVVSIDPVTKQVAMFSLPRDTVDVPVPATPGALWGSRLRRQDQRLVRPDRNRADLWPGTTTRTRGYNGLKAHPGRALRARHQVLRRGQLRGLPRGRRRARRGPDQRPDPGRTRAHYPVGGGVARVYIPAGPQHMNGAEALALRPVAPPRARRLRPRPAPAARPPVAPGADQRRGRSWPTCPSSWRTLKETVRTDIPLDRAAQAARARGQRRHEEHPLLRVRAAALRDGVRELPARLHHPAQRRADPGGGQGGVLGQPGADRAARAPRRGGRRGSGSSTGRGAPGHVDQRADYLEYNGLAASAPRHGARTSRGRRRSSSTTAPRRRCPRRSRTSRSSSGSR